MMSARGYKSAEPRRSAASAAVPPGGVRPPAPRVRSLSRRECEALLARNLVGRIAFAHRGHVDIAPTNYVYAAGWLFARAADFTPCRTLVSLAVGQAFHSMSDTRFTPSRTADSLMSDTA